MAEKKVYNFIVSENSFEKFGMMTILGTTGSAMEVQMNFFFTFWGLFLLKKRKNFFFKTRVKGLPPPMRKAGLMGSWMFKKMLKKFGYEDMYDMLKDGVEEGNIRLLPCSMTMDLLHIKKKQMYDFVEEPVGAAKFLEMCENADSVISL